MCFSSRRLIKKEGESVLAGQTTKKKQTAAKKSGGCTGEPSKSDARRGQIYHNHLVKNLIAVVEQLQNA